MHIDYLVKEVLKAAQEQLRGYKDSVLSGTGIEDFADYRYQIGFIHGAEMMAQLLIDAARKQVHDDD